MASSARSLSGKRILLGVSGGIAAYKAPELVRQLSKADAEVQVVMTRAASRFVTTTSLQAVSGNTVRDDLWDPEAEASMGHIELARWADAILVAPATADLLSRLAHGRADDLLTTLCLASRAPLYLAPAMNTFMWDAPPTRRTVAQLEADGAVLFGPAEGEQACGETGPGRMCEPTELVLSLAKALGQGRKTGPLAGKRVVITAGPTREALDPVRYLSNHSSGRQGYAFAEAARDAGGAITLISGPVTLPTPADVEVVRVSTAQEMLEASLAEAQDADLFIAVAAVADYRPARPAEQKIKKADGNNQGMLLELVENPDIVAEVAALQQRPRLVVGFAAETEKLGEHARSKLKRKKLDAIVVNDVSRQDIGFEAPENAATLIYADAETQLPRQSKYSLACRVIQELSRHFEAQLANANPEDLAI